MSFFGRGSNVLMEDGSVKLLPSGVCNIGSDNIFFNDEGRLGPGVHENDTVIAPSIQRLRVWLVVRLPKGMKLVPGTRLKH